MSAGAAGAASPVYVVEEFDEEPGHSAADNDEQNNSSTTRNARRPAVRRVEYTVSVPSAAPSTAPATGGGTGRCKLQAVPASLTTTSNNLHSTTFHLSRIRHKLGRIVSDLFLPVGYPHTVRDGYLRYQLYDSAQGLCSYLRGVLCSAAVLEAAGVGDADATALAAALTWARRDGLALAGGLAYSYCAAPHFDAHVKEFRLLADVVNDAGFFLDMLAPVLGRRYLLWTSSAAVLCKTLCGISAGATRGSITCHFAVGGNVADLNAKEATQETFVSLAGMLLGVAAAHWLQSHQEAAAERQQHNNNNQGAATAAAAYWNWGLFAVLTAIHVWANWRGVTLLRMRTLNRARADLVLRETIGECCRATAAAASSGNQTFDEQRLRAAVARLPPPAKVDESILVSAWGIVFTGRLELGVPLVRLLEQRPEAIEPISSSSAKYAAALQNGGGTAATTTPSSKTNNSNVLVSLLVGAGQRDELRAYVHASALARGQSYRCEAAVEYLFGEDDVLLNELRNKGWDVDRFYFGFARRRGRLTTRSLEQQGKKEN